MALLLALPLAAQSPRANLVVSPKWLNEHLSDRNLVILHVGDRPGYDAAHIPNARYITLNQIAAPRGPANSNALELPGVDSLHVALSRLGISDDSRIVVYYGKDWVSHATRVILTLDHAGFGDVTSLLDGGMGAWTREGYKTTADAPAVQSGKLSALKTKTVTVSGEYVRDNIGKPGVAVIDGRAAVFYDGIEEGGPMDAHRRGHIKGALSVPFTEITDDSLAIKSTEQLQALFTKAGVKPGDTIIGYCHIGQQATAMLFGARTLGYKVLLYDGSFEDWARRNWAVEVPSGK